MRALVRLCRFSNLLGRTLITNRSNVLMLREGWPDMERVVERWRSYAATLAIVAAVAVLPQPASAATPSNDNFADRTAITALPFTDAQDTTDATEEADEPRPRCADIAKSVWYEFTPSTDGVFQVDTFGSDFDTAVAIWTGDALSNLTQEACDDDTGPGVESMVTLSASAGTAYFIQAGGYDDFEAGALTLSLGAPTSGSISGKVTTSNGGAPLPETCVQIRTAGDGWGGPWVETSSSGRYTIGGLSDGTYQMRFFDRCDNQRDHTEEWFDNQPTQATATEIVLTSPEAITGIDTELTALPLGFISGTVTSSKGGPLPDICVEVYSSDGEYFGFTQTTSSGSYTFGAPDGTYKVSFFDGCDDRRDHEDEWFDDQPHSWTATEVTVASPTTTEGIDAELAARGSISGTVTSDTGEVLSDICIEVYDTATGYEAGWAQTTSSGSYTASVPEGTYHVEFSDRCDALRDHRREWFDDQPTEATANEVVVTGSNTTAGIDAELTTLAFGSISGTVTSASGAPLGDICVDVYEAETGYWAGWAETTSSGSYTVPLPEGAYNVDFADWCDGQNDHLEEWFDDQPTWATATDVVVTHSGATTGIDAQLSRVTPQTSITSGPPGLTTSTTVGFTFVSSMPGSTFECSLDGRIFAACTSPMSYSALVEGFHAFRVRAIGPDGEVDPSPAERTWVVDTSAPVLSIQRPTAGAYVNNQSVGGTGPIVVAGYVIVGVTAIDPHSGVTHFMFEVDGIPVTPFDVTRDGDIFRFTYRPGSPGNHTITARATNAAGLTSNTSISVVGVPAG
jgi:hypothetical protein